MKNVFVVVFLLCLQIDVFSCTNIGITKGATEDNSNYVMMTADAGDTDFRIIYVPAADHKENSKRPIYPRSGNGTKYPRFNGSSLGPNYNIPSLKKSTPIGYIDQVSHTYAYFDAAFGVMNEHQLSISENTCAAKAYLSPKKGERIFDIVELSRIAMERCKTAKEAILLMGELAEKYGYYGWGEALAVGDKNEIWIFEICSSEKSNALWVAKKVPDGEVFISANEFRIRDIVPGKKDILYSKNLFKECEKAGWYNPEKDSTFDWLKVVSPGEYNHPYYSLRRVWRLYDKIAPSRKFSPYVEDGYTREYPFSVKPDKKLSLKNIFDLTRDWYQDTEFDLSKDIAGGPYGNINRYGTGKVKGNWERAISVWRAAYVVISQIRSDLPDPIGGIVWWGCDAPHSTCFVPFYSGVNDLPKAYQIGHQKTLDRSSAWWAFNYVSNLLDIKFNYMIKDVIEKQNEIEMHEIEEVKKIDKIALALYKNNPAKAKEYLTKFSEKNANKVFKEWWKLADDLMVKYQDGNILENEKFKPSASNPEWLKSVGFKSIVYKKINKETENKMTKLENDVEMSDSK
jgi:dipeptidase